MGVIFGKNEQIDENKRLVPLFWQIWCIFWQACFSFFLSNGLFRTFFLTVLAEIRPFYDFFELLGKMSGFGNLNHILGMARNPFISVSFIFCCNIGVSAFLVEAFPYMYAVHEGDWRMNDHLNKEVVLVRVEEEGANRGVNVCLTVAKRLIADFNDFLLHVHWSGANIIRKYYTRLIKFTW